PDFLLYVGSILGRRSSHLSRAQTRRPERSLDDARDTAPSPIPNPEQLLVAVEEHAANKQIFERVREAMDGDALGRQVLDLVQQGVTPETQAERLSVPVMRVYNALRRIRYRLENVGSKIGRTTS